MNLSPYLFFNGDCEAAFKFYEKVLGGKIDAMIPHQGTPAAKDVPPEWQKKILHGRLLLGDWALMASDAPPGRYSRPQGFSVSLEIETPDESERVFHALAEKGSVVMPIQETFWAKRFGMLTDRFGIPWMINCSKPM
jgi:PhnB protein